jgi:Mg-chelatase subunit ChlD
MFNIVVYSVGVKPWKRRMQAANLKNKKAARKFVDGLEPNGGTNIFDALLESLDLAAGVGKKKKKAKPGADPVADTIFFLTDGQPSAGRITDAKQILEEITKRNELLGVKIHTVGVSREQNAGFLLNLAKRNHGQYVAAK